MIAFIKSHAAAAIILLLLVGGITAGLVVGGSQPKKTKPVASAHDCGSYRQDGVMTINNQHINVEIAYTPTAKAKGLGGRPCIKSNQGMLFDFGKDGQYAMWMKDMKFPIDIVWINSQHQVAGMWQDVEPSTYHSKNPFFANDSQHPARYVLELKSNKTKELNLMLGTLIHFQKS